jgi:hypothetical protein
MFSKQEELYDLFGGRRAECKKVKYKMALIENGITRET